MGKREKDLEIWNSSDWVRRRKQCRHFRQWYDGLPLQETMDKRNRNTGSKIRRYPLGINLPKLACDIHRDIARGVPRGSELLVVKAVVDKGDDPEQAEIVENLINNKVWQASQGSAVQQEALLSMNIYGGTVLKLSWEPWDFDLPYRLAVRLVKNPGYIMPLWDNLNPWRMLECYLGYEIPASVALARYGIEVQNTSQSVLRLEHWTPTRWCVTIDGQVPTMKWGSKTWKLEGENPWGFVPIYYAPHERTTNLFGDSAIEDQEDLTLDLNTNMSDLSDLVRSAHPGILWGSDLGSSLPMRKVLLNGEVMAYVLDVGHTKAAQRSANRPQLNAFPVPDVPDSITGHPRTLLDFWMMVARISPASFGLDDTSSGRITGRAVTGRMWTSVAHATTERINFTTAKTMVDRDIIRATAVQKDALKELGITPLPLDTDRYWDIKQDWWPEVPLSAIDDHQRWIERLREGGASIEEYLHERGVDDVEGERERIIQWLEDKETAKKPASLTIEPPG